MTMDSGLVNGELPRVDGHSGGRVVPFSAVAWKQPDVSGTCHDACTGLDPVVHATNVVGVAPSPELAAAVADAKPSTYAVPSPPTPVLAVVCAVLTGTCFTNRCPARAV